MGRWSQTRNTSFTRKRAGRAWAAVRPKYSSTWSVSSSVRCLSNDALSISALAIMPKVHSLMREASGETEGDPDQHIPWHWPLHIAQYIGVQGISTFFATLHVHDTGELHCCFSK